MDSMDGAMERFTPPGWERSSGRVAYAVHGISRPLRTGNVTVIAHASHRGGCGVFGAARVARRGTLDNERCEAQDRGVSQMLEMFT
jgi:hypothetical protein